MFLLKKTIEEYYQNLDEKNIMDNKKFWKPVKTLLSDKTVFREKTSLAENEKTLTFEPETAETLILFSNIVKKLEIPKFDVNDLVTVSIKNPIFKALLKYKNHHSILANQKYSKNKIFHFKEVNIGEVEKKIRKLDKTKPSQKADIAARIIKENNDILAEFLCTSINIAIKSVSFLSSLKLADLTPLYKKGRKDIKENHMWMAIPDACFLIMFITLSHTLSKHKLPCLNGFKTFF